MEKRRLGELLVEDYRLTREQVTIALDFQKTNTEYRGKKIGQILIALGWLENYTIEKYLVIQSGHFDIID